MFRSIGAKVSTCIASMTALAACIVGFAGSWQQNALSEQAIGAALQQRYDAVLVAMAERGLRAEAAARVLANDPRTVQAFVHNDRRLILAALRDIAEPLRVRPGTHDARAMRRIRTMAAAA